MFIECSPNIRIRRRGHPNEEVFDPAGGVLDGG
jgi:hypothetical protein